MDTGHSFVSMVAILSARVVSKSRRMMSDTRNDGFMDGFGQ